MYTESTIPPAKKPDLPMPKLEPIGGLTFFGLTIGILLITLAAGVNYGSLLSNFIQFATGHLSQVPNGSEESIVNIIVYSAALSLVALPVAIASAILTSKLTGQAKSYNMAAMMGIIDKGPIPLFVTVLVEEIVARWIPLGLLTQVFKGPEAFYILLVVFNFLWGAIHLLNFKDKKEWNLLRFLPQMLAGLFFAYFFVRYGFWVTLFAHFLYDVVVFSSYKEQPVTTSDFKVGLFYLGVAIVSGLALNSRGFQFEILTPLLERNGDLTAFKSLSFWDFFFLLAFVDGLFEFLSNLLLMDRHKLTKDYVNPFLLLLTVPSMVLMILGINWVVGKFVDIAVIRALVITLVIVLLTPSNSGSMMARHWFTNIPVTFMMVAAFTTLDFWSSALLLFIYQLVEILPRVWRLEQERNTAAFVLNR